MLNIKHNLCALDRALRGIIAIALLSYVIFFGEQIGDVLLQAAILIFAVLNLISFFLGWCPVYQVANISTCRKK
ncbi:YgaP family membrane protein [Thalassotalea sp. PLHSN55]|uniref:YgaP family membrane protein n=1 Tax=Thalassotalea sp. PLHSN55 TaxID=3435888 RepID=UPI003F825804